MTIHKPFVTLQQISDKMKLHLPATTTGQLESDLTEDESERLLAMERRQQQQKQVQRDLEFEAGLVEERTQRIQAIENDIIDVNKIMSDLSEMVLRQGEVVGKIKFEICHCGQILSFKLNFFIFFILKDRLRKG